MFPAPLGSIRKRKADGLSWKDRLILNLKFSQANKLVELWERAVPPLHKSRPGHGPTVPPQLRAFIFRPGFTRGPAPQHSDHGCSASRGPLVSDPRFGTGPGLGLGWVGIGVVFWLSRLTGAG